MRPTTGSTSPTTQDFVWNTSTSVPEVLMDGTNAYIYGPGSTPIEQVNLSTGTLSYLVADSLGSVRGIVSSSGSLTASASYDAYGNPEATGGLTSYTPFGFAGGYTDATGLTYLINRYDDPQTGQFLSVDPLVDETGEPYSYTGGDPVNGVDPSGEITLCALGYCVHTGYNPKTLEDVGSEAEQFGRGALGYGPLGLLLHTAPADNSCAPTSLAFQLGEDLSFAPDPELGEARDLFEGDEAASAQNGTNLGKQLASQQQMGETGTPMAGAGSPTALRVENDLAQEYGGSPSDWTKMTSSSYTGADGQQFETHWYENTQTGQRVEFKTKFQDNTVVGYK